MNIKDIKTEAPTEGDMLENIFDRQADLMAKYHSIEEANGLLLYKDIPIDLHDRRGQERVKQLAMRVRDELSEATHTLKNSAWKQTHMLTDTDHFYEELADAFHFMVELFIAVGLSAEDLYKLYYRKSDVNRFRQDSGY